MEEKTVVDLQLIMSQIRSADSQASLELGGISVDQIEAILHTHLQDATEIMGRIKQYSWPAGTIRSDELVVRLSECERILG